MGISKEHFLEEFTSRTKQITGNKSLENIIETRVALVGLGGVGSSVAEALCRTGVSRMLLVDGDIIHLSNLNRQLYATVSNVNINKAAALSEYMNKINPYGKFDIVEEFVNEKNIDVLFNWKPDVLVDAVDNVIIKLLLAEESFKKNIIFISSMGAGGKSNPSEIKTSKIFDTTGCPLSRKIRKEMKKRNIHYNFPVVFSKEESSFSRERPGSIITVTSVFGFYIANWIIEQICMRNEFTEL